MLIGIAGVDQTQRTRVASTVRIEYELGARARADLEILDLDSFETAYRPTLDQRLDVWEAGLRLFNGSIWSVDDGPLGEPGVGTVTRIQGINDWRFAAQRRVVRAYDAGWTLQGVVSDLVTAYLSVFDITLDAGMPVGPTLPALTFDQSTIEDVFGRLSDLTGWVYRLTPDNVIQWFVIGSKLRALTLSAANHNILGAVRWSQSRNQAVNRVLVRYGTATLVQKHDAWTGAAQSVFPLTYPGVLYPNGMIYGWTVQESGLNYPCALWGVDSGYLWYYDNTSNALRRASPAPNGVPISFDYMVQFPLTVSAPTPPPAIPNEVLVERPEIFDKAEAQAVADSLVRRYTALPRTVTLRTRAAVNLLPGDTVTLDIPSRTLPAAPWLITAVSLTCETDQQITTTLRLLEGTEAQASWIDYWREAFSTGTGSGVGVASGGAIPSAPPPPAPAGAPGGGDLTGGGTAPQLAVWSDTKVLAASGINVDSAGTLIGGATGAGFTINLTTSTVIGTLPAACLPVIPVDKLPIIPEAKLPANIAYWDQAETFTQANTFASGQVVSGTLILKGANPETQYRSTSTYYGSILGTSQGLELVAPAGYAIIFTGQQSGIFCDMGTGGGIFPIPGYSQKLGNIAAKWLSLHVAELWVETLVQQDTLATVGGRIVVCPTTALTRDLPAGQTTCWVKHNIFRLQVVGVTLGSTLILQVAGKFEVLVVMDTVAPVQSPQGDYGYTVSRGAQGTSQAWYAGDAVMDTGIAGNGFIDLYSVRGLKATSEAGPTIVGNVRLSYTPWNNWAPRWAIGNLQGLYGYGAATYGAAFGDANSSHLLIDATNGVRIRYGNADRLIADTAGNLTLSGNLTVAGAAQIAAGGVLITSGGIETAMGTDPSAGYAYNFNSPYDTCYNGLFGSESNGVTRTLHIFNGDDDDGLLTIHPPEATVQIAARNAARVRTLLTLTSSTANDSTVYLGGDSTGLQMSNTFMIHSTPKTAGCYLTLRSDIVGIDATYLYPQTTNVTYLGAGQNRWATLYTTYIDCNTAVYTPSVKDMTGATILELAGNNFQVSVATTPTRSYIQLYAGGSVGTIILSPYGGTIQALAQVIYGYDNYTLCGQNTNRWASVWSVNGTIQTSDAETKDAVAPSPLGLAFVERLAAKQFRYLDDPTPGRIGFLTQDVEAALEGHPFAALVKPETGPAGLNYAGFVPVLTQAVQELAARVRALEGATHA
jgi:Chaperone of endosialidase